MQYVMKIKCVKTSHRGKIWEKEEVFLINITNIVPNLKIVKANSASDNSPFSYSHLYTLLFLPERAYQ